MKRTSDIGETLPPLATGTFEHRGIVFLRAGHLSDWLEEIANAPGGRTRPAGELLDEMRAMIADVGGLRRRG